MLERKTVSQCPTADYCKGWNDAVDAMPKWISAMAEHPKDQAVVLIYCNDGEVGAARFEEEYGCFVTTEKGTWKGAYGAVTHWMPLPSTEGIE